MNRAALIARITALVDKFLADSSRIGLRHLRTELHGLATAADRTTEADEADEADALQGDLPVDVRRRPRRAGMERLACGHRASEARNHCRPCAFVGCRHSLYLDVNPETGSIKFVWPDLEPDQLEHSCSLDLADRGAMTLEQVGAAMNFTRERSRQIEVRASLSARAAMTALDIDGADAIAPDVPSWHPRTYRTRIPETP